MDDETTTERVVQRASRPTVDDTDRKCRVPDIGDVVDGTLDRDDPSPVASVES